MDITQLLTQADGGSGDLSNDCGSIDEPLVRGDGVSQAIDDPALSWQENDPIPPPPEWPPDSPPSQPIVVINDGDGDGDDGDDDLSFSTPLQAPRGRQQSETPTQRSRPSSLAPQSAKKIRKRNKKPTSGKARTRLVFSTDMTIRIMELFLEEARAGNMKDAKAAYLKPAMERIRKKMEVEYPQYPWAVAKVVDKLNNEKKRYRVFVTLMAISGPVRLGPRIT